MKRILIIHNKYKFFGGEDSNISEEIDLLKKHYDVEYLEYKNSDKFTIYDLFSFINNSNRLANKKLEKVIDEFNPDIAYVHNTWFKINLGVFKVLERKKVKVLIKLHNYRYECCRYFLLKKHLKRRLLCGACGLKRNRGSVFNKFDKESYVKSFLLINYSRKHFNILKNNQVTLLVMNEFQKNFLNEIGIRKEKIEIYPNPIKLSKNGELGYKIKSDYVIFAGRLSDAKGIEELINAWISADKEGLSLKIIGEGPLGKKMKEKFMSNDIKFLGQIEHKETLEYIKNARAIVTATKMYEGQPRLLCEASSYGVPSIYPSFGGMDEFFPNDYKLSFKQYDYSEMKKKISKLNNNELMKNESSRVFNHISKKLNEDELINNFQKIIENEIAR